MVQLFELFHIWRRKVNVDPYERLESIIMPSVSSYSLVKNDRRHFPYIFWFFLCIVLFCTLIARRLEARQVVSPNELPPNQGGKSTSKSGANSGICSGKELQFFFPLLMKVQAVVLICEKGFVIPMYKWIWYFVSLCFYCFIKSVVAMRFCLFV